MKKRFFHNPFIYKYFRCYKVLANLVGRYFMLTNLIYNIQHTIFLVYLDSMEDKTVLVTSRLRLGGLPSLRVVALGLPV